MRTRFRTLAALLALFAFSASFAEQVWASTCAPAAVEQAGHHAAAESHVDGSHGAIEMPSAPAPHRGPDVPDECPVQALAVGCALLPLPAPVREAPAPADAPRVLAAPYTDPSREILLVTAFFRPPQR